MKTQLQAWQTSIDALSLKERCLVLAAAILLAAFAWESWLLAPLDKRQARLQREVDTVAQTLQQTDALVEEVVRAGQFDPDADTRTALATATAELAQTQDEIKAKVGRMVPPEQMAEVLKSVLSGFDDLRFVGLEGLAVEPLQAPAEVTPADAVPNANPIVSTQPFAYRHGMRIRFAGSYHATLAYVRALEALPWGFFWDEVRLEATDYPNAEGAIVVYTLSLERGWIGV